MAITQAICNSYKRDVHDGLFLAGHSYKMALYTPAASLDKNTAAYTASNEVANGNGYTTGGKVLTGRAVSLQGDKGCLDFSDPAWAAASFTARGALIYDDTLAGKDAIAVLDFGADITATNGTFTVDLPAPGAATSLVRIN